MHPEVGSSCLHKVDSQNPSCSLQVQGDLKM
jgi:hypothetical protein